MKQEGHRATLSASGVAREYGIAIATVLAAIHSEELRASRLGAGQFIVFRADVETWLRRHTFRVGADARRIVEERVRHEREIPPAAPSIPSRDRED